MHLGKSQDDLADQFALGSGQLQKSVESLALQVAHALVPALAVRLHRLADGIAKTQDFRLDFKYLRQRALLHKASPLSW